MAEQPRSRPSSACRNAIGCPGRQRPPTEDGARPAQPWLRRSPRHSGHVGVEAEGDPARSGRLCRPMVRLEISHGNAKRALHNRDCQLGMTVRNTHPQHNTRLGWHDSLYVC